MDTAKERGGQGRPAIKTVFPSVPIVVMIFAMAPACASHVWSIGRSINSHARRSNIRCHEQVGTAEILGAGWEGKMPSSITCPVRPIIGVTDTACDFVIIYIMATLAIRRRIPGRRLIVTGCTGTDGIPGRIIHMTVETIEADSSRSPQTWVAQSTGALNSPCNITGRIAVGYIRAIHGIVPAEILRRSLGRGMGRVRIVALHTSRSRSVSSRPK